MMKSQGNGDEPAVEAGEAATASEGVDEEDFAVASEDVASEDVDLDSVDLDDPSLPALEFTEEQFLFFCVNNRKVHVVPEHADDFVRFILTQKSVIHENAG